MKKIAMVSMGAMFLLFVFALPASSQLAWKYTFINGTGGLPKSSLPAPSSLVMQATPSNYPNIALHLNANVDQSEMSIKAGPGNSFNVLAGANAVVQNVYPVSYNQGHYYSATEGGYWGGSDTLPTNVTYTSDPAVSYDLNGNAFFSFLKSSDGFNTSSVVVKKSTNGGASWGSDITVAGPVYLLDKEHITIDVNPSSAYKNFIYVAWTDFGAYPYSTKCSRSTDGGSTFSSPVTVSGTSGYATAQGVCLAVGPNGELYATWAYYTGGSYEATLGFNKSTNGGVSWGTASMMSISGFSGIRGYLKSYPPDYYNTIRVASFPAMDVDRSGGPTNGKIYVVWANGKSTSQHNYPDVKLISSVNGGSSWSASSTVNSDTTSDQWEPWVNVDPYGGVNVVFYDSRIDPTNNILTQAYMARSTNGGTSFSNYQISDVAFTPLMIPNTAYGYMGDYIGITSTREYAIPCWNDNRTGNQQAYTAQFNILLDLAMSNKSVNYSATAGNNDHVLEHGLSGKLHEVFASGGEVFYRRSVNGGSTWDITARLSSGNGSNEAPSIVAGYGYPEDNLRAVWQRKLSDYGYEIRFAYSTNGGVSWSTSAVVTNATVSYDQSNLNGAPGPTPVIGSYFCGGSEGTPSYLLVYAAQEGLHYRTAPNNGASWSTPSPDIVPGSEGSYDPYGQRWYCSNWYPCLASYNSQDYRVNLTYGNRWADVYSQYYYSEDTPWWSSRSVANWTGSYPRYSSIAVDYNNSMLGVWSSWNGSQWVTNFRFGYSDNSWSPWERQWAVAGTHSLLPVVTYYNKGGGYPYGIDILWYTTNNQIHQRKYYGIGDVWYEYQIASNGLFANVTHERYDSGIPKQSWTDQSASPYQILLGSQNLPKTSSSFASNDARRAAVIFNTADRSRLQVEFSQPVITTTAGTQLAVPFKEYDYRQKLALSTSTVFDYLQTEEITVPSDAADVTYAMTVTASGPDTLATGKVNPDKKTDFTGIATDLRVKEKAGLLLSGGATTLRDAKGLHAFTKTFSIPAASLRGKTVSLVPTVKFDGMLNEKNLAFTLLNISGGGSSPGIPLPKETAMLTEDQQLGQNYPNPFNPTTNVAYRVTKAGFVSLKIFDVLGREVATLVNEEKAVGTYSVQFDASHLASGIYFARLQAGSYVATRKLSLVK